MIDENLNPWLIEVNKSPSWAMSLDIYKDLKKRLLYNMIDLVLLLNLN